MTEAASGRRHRRSDDGVSTMELLLSITIVGIIIVPLTMWVGLTFKSTDTADETSVEAVGQSLLTAAFETDVRTAYRMREGGTKCLGSNGDGDLLAVIELPNFAATGEWVTGDVDRIEYTVGLDEDGVMTLWRRHCTEGGNPTSASRILSGVVVPLLGAGEMVDCDQPGWDCQEMSLTVETAAGEEFSVQASKRRECDYQPDTCTVMEGG